MLKKIIDFITGRDCMEVKRSREAKWVFRFMVAMILLVMVLGATGCATTVAVVDVAASTTIYAGKTVVNTIDAITPDIVNKDEKSNSD